VSLVKHLVACALCIPLFGPVQAADATPQPTPAMAQAASELRPRHQGYAFEQPQLLLRQRLFGLAHGLSMLAAACLDLPRHSTPIQDAYASWHGKQTGTIEVLVLDLARYYFGERADEASWFDLARALGLNDSIEPALRDVSLDDACASLPQAIVGPRYDFARLLADAAAPDSPATVANAVPPATEGSPRGTPTSPKPAE